MVTLRRNEELTAISEQYTEYHHRVRRPSLTASLDRTCDRGNYKIHHEYSEYDSS